MPARHKNKSWRSMATPGSNSMVTVCIQLSTMRLCPTWGNGAAVRCCGGTYRRRNPALVAELELLKITTRHDLVLLMMYSPSVINGCAKFERRTQKKKSADTLRNYYTCRPLMNDEVIALLKGNWLFQGLDWCRKRVANSLLTLWTEEWILRMVAWQHY